MDAVEEVKARLSIEDVISEYVQLKRAGRNWKGLSPFTSERTPSFVVSPEKQIWHDFSSGKGGNVFSFVMEMEGLDFKGALEMLARRAGVDLAQYHRSGQRGGPNKERLHALLELSTKFYQVQFSKSSTALRYALQKRAFTKETALAWRLGYAPVTGTALVGFLKRQGFNEAEMQQAGVTSQRYVGGVRDMFRGRLMIPLADPQGRVVGFTARLLADDPDAPKYINTPATALYDKSRHVFGLHFAKEAIRKGAFAVVAEGNLDVITSHQAGIRQVVATAGTALTAQHLKVLSRLTGDIRLCFDADRAGLAATERAIPIASKAKVSLSIITIPSGKDPDELIRQDADTWKKIIQSPQYALDWLMERYTATLDITTAPGKRAFSDVLLPVVRSLDDAVERDHYLERIAVLIGVSRLALEQKSASLPVTARPALRQSRRPAAPFDKQAAEHAKTQDRLLALALAQPQLRGYLALITPDMLAAVDARQLLDYLRTTPGAADAADAALKPIAEYGKIVGLQYEELYQGLELTELHYEAARLQARLVEAYVRQQKQTLAAQLDEADETRTAALLEQVRQLDALLKQVKGEAHHAQE